MKGYIYIIINRLNGKVYIGQTKNIKKRISSHFSGNSQRYVCQDIQKYGRENFDWQVLDSEIPTQEQLDTLEREYIHAYKSMIPNGYNMVNGRADESYEKDSLVIRTYRRNKNNGRDFAIPDEYAQIAIDLYNQTGSLDTVGASFNVSSSAVLRFLKKHNIPRKTLRGTKRMDLTKEEFIALYDKLGNTKNMSEHLGLTAQAVSYYKSKFGLPTKKYKKL